MNHVVSCTKKDLMSFTASVDNHQLILDQSIDLNGNDEGPRPKPLLLAALAGCSGMDVISILEKMRVDYDNFTVITDGELTEEHPKYYHKIHLTYQFKGKNLPKDKIEKAINLSLDRYCGVYAMLKKAANITFEIKIEDPL